MKSIHISLIEIPQVYISNDILNMQVGKQVHYIKIEKKNKKKNKRTKFKKKKEKERKIAIEI